MLGTPRLLIQVVPRMTPGRCGVSDPALLLAGELKAGFGIETAFAVLNSGVRASVPQPTVYCAAEELVENCLKLAEGRPAAVLVHLSGYGYSPDGAPARLAVALAALRDSGRFQIGVYFHELFAGGRPWQLAYWNARRQQKVLRAIVAQSDLLVTNIRAHADWLERQAGAGVAVHLLPVFATVGESETPRPIAQRSPAMAVFGLPDSRRRAYRELPALHRAFRLLEIAEIVDVGLDCDAPGEVLGIPVRRLGEQPAAALDALFSSLRFGLVAMPPFCLAKSSIFANLCSHGTIPLLTTPIEGEVDGLRDGAQVVSARTVDAVCGEGLDAVSQAAWRWYWGHRRRVHAALYAQWLGVAPAQAFSAAQAAVAAEVSRS